jgi:hypothetical protein
VALFAIRGYLRALTTFSTFSVEAVTLLAREEYIWAIYHITTADDDSSGDWYLSEVMVVATGVLLRGQRHQGEVLYDWLRRARVMGITGGAAYREIAGYGCHDRLPGWRVVRASIAELRLVVFWAMCGVTLRSRRSSTNSCTS